MEDEHGAPRTHPATQLDESAPAGARGIGASMAGARDCPECGCAAAVRLEMCDVCYADVGERERTLFWDLRVDDYVFRARTAKRS